MKKSIVAGVALIMACSVAVTSVAACARKSGQAAPQEATATTVRYRQDGTYTTQVTFGDGGLTGVSADDVQVTYELFSEDDYNAAFTDQTESQVSQSISAFDYYNLAYAQVTNVTVNNDSVMSVSFVDSNAASNGTDGYSVYIKSKNIYAEVPVDFTEHIITAKADGEDFVLISDSAIRLTLVLDDGEFATPFPSDAIALSGSFKGMNISDVEANGKNLTIQLTGELSTDEYTQAYLDGVVNIAAEGIKDAQTSATASIPVKAEDIRFLSSGLEVSDSKISAPLSVSGPKYASLTKEDIVFEADSGVTVENLKRENGVIVLTLDVGAVADKNAAAEKLNGKTATIDGSEVNAVFNAATFYPVFEYVEKSGDNLRFTLDLYAKGGTFAALLAPQNFEYGDGFEGAQFVSVSRKNDTVAELIIDVPAGSNTPDNLDIDGTVAVKAGALINSWGQATASDAKYTRNYSQGNMGRDLSDSDVDAIKKIVGGFGNTTTGTILGVASGAISGAQGIYTVLNFMGVVQSSQDQVLDLVKQISDKLNTMNDTLNRQYETIRQMQKKEFSDNLNDFDTALYKLSTLCDNIEGFLRKGANQAISGLTLPAVSGDSTEQQCKDYTSALVKGIQGLEESGYSNSMFKGFTDDCKALLDAYRNVVSVAVKSVSSGGNPMAEYDTYCTLTCNFDTQTYGMRTAFRTNLRYNLERAFGDLVIWYEGNLANEDLAKCKNQLNEFENLVNDNGEFVVQKRNDARAHCYVMNMDFIRSWSWTPNYNYYETNIYNGSCAISHHEMQMSSPGAGPALGFQYKFNTVYDSDFQEDQRNEFVNRMNGRTMRQEAASAGFLDPVDKVMDTDNSAGVAFYRWKDNDGGYYVAKCRHYYHRYAYYIPWDGTTMEKVTTYREYNSENKTLVCNWWTN